MKWQLCLHHILMKRLENNYIFTLPSMITHVKNDINKKLLGKRLNCP